MFEKTMRYRALRALLVCMAMIMAFILLIFASGGSWAGESRNASVGQIWKSIQDGASFESAVEEVGSMVLEKGSLPNWMVDELLDESWLDKAISTRDQNVVWISRPGNKSGVKEEMRRALASKGWEEASSNVSENSIITFVKEEGECRWLFVEYAQSENETVAVLRIERN